MSIRGPLRSIARGVLVATALVLAAASCGREPTAAANVGVAKVNLELALQTSGGDEVSQVVLTIYALNPAGSAQRRREVKVHRFGLDASGAIVGGVETDDQITFVLDFPLIDGATYEVEGGAFSATGAELFHVNTVSFIGKPATSGSQGATVSTTVVYVGPGANAVRISVTPTTARLKPGETANFTATAFDASNNVVTGGRIRWNSSNPNIVTFPNQLVGAAQGGQQAGTATITASMEETGVSGTASVTLELTPTSIQVIGGGGQTATAGTQLPNSIRVRVMSNTAPVPGVTVTFAARSGSGSVTPASAVTNGTGEAETRWTLGGTAGTQTIDVATAGLSAVSVSATATAPPRTISIISTTPTSITTTQSSSMLVEVRSNGNPVAGEVVTFTSSAGGSFSPTTVTTNSSGQATSVFTAANPGNYQVSASISGGVSTPTTTITVTQSTTVATLIIIQGNGQTVRQNSEMDPMIVQAKNAAGVAVQGVVIQWMSGTTVLTEVATDENGLVAVRFSSGSTTGTGSIVARVKTNTSISVTFSFTVVP
jgi:hypothetical protein